VTDANGRYSIEVAAGDHSYRLSSGEAGWISTRTLPTNGDLFANVGNCQGRYGIVFDASSGHPLANVTVDLTRSVTTGIDGWYRVDAGCGRTFFNTTFFTATATGYETYSYFMGRYVNTLIRQDIGLKRK